MRFWGIGLNHDIKRICFEEVAPMIHKEESARVYCSKCSELVTTESLEFHVNEHRKLMELHNLTKGEEAVDAAWERNRCM